MFRLGDADSDLRDRRDGDDRMPPGDGRDDTECDDGVGDPSRDPDGDGDAESEGGNADVESGEGEGGVYGLPND